MRDASAISNNYADLVALGARQAMAGVDITVSKGTDNAWNISDVKVFMKDTGVSQYVLPNAECRSTMVCLLFALWFLRRISPVDGLFSALPIFLYLNSSLGGLLLDPLLELQASFGGSDYSASDLGMKVLFSKRVQVETLCFLRDLSKSHH